jgi:hypothetical protein
MKTAETGDAPRLAARFRRGRTRSGILGPALLCTALLLVATPSRADFGTVRRIVNGTAYTLEQGELAVGVFSPVQYGLLDEITIATHPVLDLLLTPNVAFKGKVYDGPVAISLNATYIETFLNSAQQTFPGTLSLYPMLTVPIGHAVSLTAQGGYNLDVSPVSHGAMFGLNATFLLGPADLVQITVQDQWYSGGQGFRVPTAVVSYSHAWYRLRVSVGVAAGRFPLQIGGNGARVLNLPVYPVFDVWWLL